MSYFNQRRDQIEVDVCGVTRAGKIDAGDHTTNSGNHGTLSRRPSRNVMFPPRLPPITALMLSLIGVFWWSALAKLTIKFSSKSRTGDLPVASKSGIGIPGGMTGGGGGRPKLTKAAVMEIARAGGRGNGTGSLVSFGCPISINVETRLKSMFVV